MSEALAEAGAKNYHPLLRAQRLVAQPLAEAERLLSEVTESSVSLVPEVSRHLIGAGGKRIRPTLLLLTAKMCGADPQKGIRLAVATELFHNASLLHDDVVDRGQVRRGVAAAPRVFGNAASVLVGDFLMAKAFGLVVRHGNLSLLDSLSEVITHMAEGEVMQLVRSGRITLSIEHYEEIISGKTAGLFSWCCLAGASLADIERRMIEAAAKAGRLFGMAFQITDDVLDYTATPEQSGKDLANDLIEGKTTLPLLLACEEDRSLLEEVETMAARGPSEKECQEIVRRVRSSSAIERSLSLARKYVEQLAACLEIFDCTESAEAITDLANFVVSRTS